MTPLVTQALDPTLTGFSPAELEQFRQQGYVIARRLAPSALVAEMRRVTTRHLAERIEPLELEAALGYPGAPPSRAAEGGDAIRRLRQAYDRAPVFRAWLGHEGLVARLRQLLGSTVLMPRAHHNCVMTKHPRYSSDSLWHQDIRYWRYSRAELVTAWLALGEEHAENGGLQLIPGSHRMEFAADSFDDALFFRSDLPRHQRLLAAARAVHLQPGDVLFFHCRLLHAATRNYRQEPKYAAVFTFRHPEDRPIPGSQSASLPDVSVCEAE